MIPCAVALRKNERRKRSQRGLGPGRHSSRTIGRRWGTALLRARSCCWKMITHPLNAQSLDGDILQQFEGRLTATACVLAFTVLWKPSSLMVASSRALCPAKLAFFYLIIWGWSQTSLGPRVDSLIPLAALAFTSTTVDNCWLCDRAFENGHNMTYPATSGGQGNNPVSVA